MREINKIKNAIKPVLESLLNIRDASSISHFFHIIMDLVSSSPILFVSFLLSSHLPPFSFPPILLSFLLLPPLLLLPFSPPPFHSSFSSLIHLFLLSPYSSPPSSYSSFSPLLSFSPPTPSFHLLPYPHLPSPPSLRSILASRKGVIWP